MRLITILICLMVPSIAFSAITLPWSTTFNYAECTQRGGGGATNCNTVQNDGITWSWGGAAVDGHYTQITTAANNPSGGGGNGFRAWVGDGTNINSGAVRVDFPSAQKEIWMRWYSRYEVGFSWAHLYYDKIMWIYTGRGMSLVPEWNNNTMAGDTFTSVALQSAAPYSVQTTTAGGWNAINGGPASDGKFHCYEIYLKMDTNKTDGIGRIWIDGVLLASTNTVNWSDGNSIDQLGFTWFEFFGNQSSVANGKPMYVDFDDWAIYNTTPPNRDAQGNAFIGPILSTNIRQFPGGLRSINNHLFAIPK